MSNIESSSEYHQSPENHQSPVEVRVPIEFNIHNFQPAQGDKPGDEGTVVGELVFKAVEKPEKSASPGDADERNQRVTAPEPTGHLQTETPGFDRVKEAHEAFDKVCQQITSRSYVRLLDRLLRQVGLLANCYGRAVSNRGTRGRSRCGARWALWNDPRRHVTESYGPAFDGCRGYGPGP